MVGIGVSVRSHIGAMKAEVRRELAKVVRQHGFLLEGEAKRRAPVDTGFLRASIYTVTARGQGGSFRRAAAAGGKRANRGMLPPPRVENDLEAAVAVGAEYGRDVEEGMVKRKAQPYMKPALKVVEPKFIRAVEEVVARANA